MMSNYDPYHFDMFPDDELPYLRRLYRLLMDCDALDDVKHDLFQEDDIGNWAELDHLMTGLAQLIPIEDHTP